MTPQAKRTLHKGLPKGYLQMAVERLAQRGIRISPAQISKVKNGVHENREVLEVLISLKNEEMRRRAELNRRILQRA